MGFITLYGIVILVGLVIFIVIDYRHTNSKPRSQPLFFATIKDRPPKHGERVMIIEERRIASGVYDIEFNQGVIEYSWVEVDEKRRTGITIQYDIGDGDKMDNHVIVMSKDGEELSGDELWIPMDEIELLLKTKGK